MMLSCLKSLPIPIHIIVFFIMGLINLSHLVKWEKVQGFPFGLTLMVCAFFSYWDRWAFSSLYIIMLCMIISYLNNLKDDRIRGFGNRLGIKRKMRGKTDEDTLQHVDL